MKFKKLKAVMLALFSTVAILGGTVSAGRINNSVHWESEHDKATQLIYNSKTYIDVEKDRDAAYLYYYYCSLTGVYNLKISDFSYNTDSVHLTVYYNYQDDFRLYTSYEASGFTKDYKLHLVAGRTYYFVCSSYSSIPGLNQYSICLSNYADCGWVKEHDDLYDFYWLYFKNGSFLTNAWCQIGGKWYYFDSLSHMETDWTKVDGKWYYLGTDGAMKTGWQMVDGKWYFLNNSGVMADGWQKLGGTWYYFNGGAMVTGWKSIGGKYYYFNNSGAMLNGWQKLNGVWYYFDESGAMTTGSRTISGKTYSFDSNGHCLNP